MGIEKLAKWVMFPFWHVKMSSSNIYVPSLDQWKLYALLQFCPPNTSRYYDGSHLTNTLSETADRVSCMDVSKKHFF